MVDYSQYKLSGQGTVNMPAKTYNDFFFEVSDSLVALEEEYGYQTGITVNEPSVKTNDRLYATAWTSLLASIISKVELLASHQGYQIDQSHWSAVVSLSTTKQSGSTITVSEWNQMVDELQYTITGIMDN